MWLKVGKSSNPPGCPWQCSSTEHGFNYESPVAFSANVWHTGSYCRSHQCLNYLLGNRYMNDTGKNNEDDGIPLENLPTSPLSENWSPCSFKNSMKDSNRVKLRSCSSSMTSLQELTLPAWRIAEPMLYNDWHRDSHEEGNVEDGINPGRHERAKSGSFNDGHNPTLVHGNSKEMSLSHSELDEENRLRSTIHGNDENHPEIIHDTWVSNETALNTTQKIDKVKEIGTNTEEESHEICEKSKTFRKNKMFSSVIGAFTGMFSSLINKKKCTKLDIDVDVLFINDKCSHNSSRVNMNEERNCCSCPNDRIELCSQNRFRKLSCDDLWIQDIVPVSDAEDTDSRYSMFFVKKARDKMTATENSGMDSPYTEPCVKCQCRVVTSSLAIDTARQQSIGNFLHEKQESKTHSHKKSSQQCFCSRIWNSVCREPNKAEDEGT